MTVTTYHRPSTESLTGHSEACIQAAWSIVRLDLIAAGLIAPNDCTGYALDALTEGTVNCAEGCPAVKVSDPTVRLFTSAYGGWSFDGRPGMVGIVFEGLHADKHAAAWVATHQHLVIEPDLDAATDWDLFPLTVAALNPVCEHGMSLSLCMGPMHYPSADQERQMGW